MHLGRQGSLSRTTDVADLLRPAGDPATWVFTGDSITHGAYHTHGRRSFVEHFQERVRWELRRTADCVINTGISGNTVTEVLDAFDHRVARFAPDVVAVMLGTNDATGGENGVEDFTRGLSELVSRIKKVGSHVLLQTPPPIDTQSAPERRCLRNYVDVIRDVAREGAVALVDHHDYWARRDLAHEMRSDALHPNARGHLQLARKLFIDLDIFDEASPTCALEISE